MRNLNSGGMGRGAGFTLVEMAIVLVVVGLLLGGILQGQTLIDSARVRTLTSDLEGIRTAWYTFQDQYDAVPGDFSRASTRLDSTLSDGDGDGIIDTKLESAGAWQQLSSAGLLIGSYDGLADGIDVLGDASCRAITCPRNPYGGFYKIVYGEHVPGDASDGHELFTGDKIPAKILLQLDVRLDDGLANSGSIRSHDSTDANCRTDDQWRVLGESSENCAAVIRGF